MQVASKKARRCVSAVILKVPPGDGESTALRLNVGLVKLVSKQFGSANADWAIRLELGSAIT
jgi:hypothetical protein